MKLSKVVETAVVDFMKNLEAMRPQMIIVQEAVFVQLCKGEGRDLEKVMDLVIEMSEKACGYARQFVKECSDLGGDFVLPQVSAIVKAYETGDFSEVDELPEEVRLLMLSNRNFNHNLEKDMVEKFGKNAMTIALIQDGLVVEFQRRANESLKKNS